MSGHTGQQRSRLAQPFPKVYTELGISANRETLCFGDEHKTRPHRNHRQKINLPGKQAKRGGASSERCFAALRPMHSHAAVAAAEAGSLRLPKAMPERLLRSSSVACLLLASGCRCTHVDFMDALDRGDVRHHRQHPQNGQHKSQNQPGNEQDETLRSL